MKKIIVSLLSLVMVLSSMMMPVHAQSDVEARVAELLAKMTLEQKVGQILQPDTRSITPAQVKEYFIGSILSGGGAAPSSGNTATDWADRLDVYQKAAIEGIGIPLLYGVDAVHGNNNVKNATIFPHNIGLGQANDADLMKRIGQVTAKEMRAVGANWAFSPTLGLPHNERWGRTYECFSETSKISANMGSALIEGLQGGFSSNNVIGTAKHYIGEGLARNGQNQGDIDGDLFQKELDELLVPYRQAIASGVKSVMVTYNSIDNVKCHGNKDLITNILKGDLGFKGIVITDYNGVDQIEGNLSYKQKIEKAINAGIDMLMIDGNEGSSPKWLVARNHIIDSVNAGTIAQDRLDDAVKRILTVKCEMGLLDDVQATLADRELLKQFGSDEHRQIAREAVRKSLTLLKNSETANGSTIMNDLKNMKKIAVVGSAADDIGTQCGGWTMTWQGQKGNITKGTTIYSGLRDAALDGQTIDYQANGYFTDEDYEAAIVVIGEHTPYAEGEGDRTAGGLALSKSDAEMIEKLKTSHPDLPLIAVLITGRPLTIADQVDDLDAIVMAGFPGSEGAGVADVLLGDYDFTGHLTMTWPWYAQDIANKLTDETKVLFEYGRGLKKAETTAIAQPRPNDPTVTDLAKTNGILQAEDFSSKHSEIKLENNDTSIGYFWNGYDISYKVNIPEKARYTLSVAAATQNDNVNIAFDVYVDGTLYYSVSQPAQNTGGWATFVKQALNDKISLPAGLHTLKFVSRTKDLNFDYFEFIKFDDDYQEPVVKPDTPNEGTGAVIKEGAVDVTVSSSDHSGDLSWYAGNQEIKHRNEKQDALTIRNADDSKMTTITVNDKQTYQSVLGLGTSVEESTVNNLMKMSDTTRKAFIKQLVDPKTGMGNTLFRVTIGTADFTGRPFYTYYDGTGTELNGQPDWENTTGKGFSIAKDKEYGIIQVIQEIQAIAKECGVEKDLKFFASSWTPPGWMKTPTGNSDSYKNNDLLLKGGKLSDAHIQDLAKYYVRFIEEYQKAGIPIYAMTLQNEPLLEIDYPSCRMTGSQEALLAKAIKEELAQSKVLSESEKDVKVWAFDHNFDGAESFVNELFNSAAGRENVDGIAFHPYGGSPTTMGSMYEQYKDNYTMHLTERSVWGASGANDIINWFRNGSESYNAWVTMLDSKIAPHQWVGTPDPTLFVQDANNREKYWCTPEVYIIGQFTKYVRPGYVRIGSSNGSKDSTVTNVAFKDPETGKIVMIVANNTSTAQKFKVVNNGTQFNATLEAGNVGTYIWDPIDGGTYKNITDDLTLNDAIIDGGQLNNDELGYIDANTKVNYTVNVQKAGTYKVLLDVAVGGAWDKDFSVAISQGNETLGSAHTRRYVWWDGEWNTYTKIQTYITLKETGLQTVTLSFPEAGMNFKKAQFVYEDARQSIPGQLDTTNYFDKRGCVYEDAGNFGFLDKDHYLDYKINVQKAGTYVFDLEAATSVESGVWIDLFDKNGESTYLGEMTFTNTGATDQYAHNRKEFELPEGEYVLRLKFKANNTNFRKAIIGQAMTLSTSGLVEGQISGQYINVELVGATFNEKLDPAHWQLNLPQGVEFSVVRVDDTHAQIVLINEANVDFDEDFNVLVDVTAEEFNGLAGTSLKGKVSITAVVDEETLEMDNEIPFHTQTINIQLKGGLLNDNIVEHIRFIGDAAQYVQIKDVKKISQTEVEVTLQWLPMYDDYKGTFVIQADGYTDGHLDLEKEVTLKATKELPQAIVVENEKVALKEELAYRHKGSLATQGARGNYVDYFLDVKEAGQYTISYKVTNKEAVANGLKLSGGLGLATDNLESLSFNKFWGNALGYKNTLTLQAGKQTLRFEMNNYNDGFKIEDIAIVKLAKAIDVKDQTTITADQLYDGSKTKGWGLEVKNNISNIGCSEADAYQDYFVNVEKEGYYEFSMNVARSSTTDVHAILQKVTDKVTDLGRISIANTGDWGNFAQSDKVLVKLSAGEQVLRIYDQGDGFNYRSFSLSFVKAFDKVAPVITGKDAVIYDETDLSVAEILGLAIKDNEDGDIDVNGDNVQIQTDFDGHKFGEYQVIVTVKDKAGNESQATYTIVLTKHASIDYSQDEIKVGSDFDPLKDIHVYDADGQDITDQVKVLSNNVDTSKAGEYVVTYQVVDKYGRVETFKRTVKVVESEVDIKPTPDPKPEQKPEEKPEQKPSTGDSMMIELFAGVCLLSVCGYLVLTKKRREE